MANVVTGSTNTSGALTIVPSIPKCILVVGKSIVEAATPKKIFDITGTSDAIAKFGLDTDAYKVVRALITNGANYIKGIIVSEVGEGSTNASVYEEAFTESLTDASVRTILLDTIEPAVITKLKDHLAAAESEDYFRYSGTGAAKGASANSDLNAVAQAINSDRIFVFGPNPVDESGIEVDGIITAAAAMAIVHAEIDKDPALPMNGVTIRGFNGMSRVLLKADKKALVGYGVVALENGAGNIPTIYRLVTSKSKDSTGNPEIIWQEGSVRFIADNVLESVQTVLRANYPRTKNVARVLNSIRTDVVGILQRKNDLEIIQEFDDTTVTVIKDPEDLYGALVDYEFKVVTPLYTITITQHMKL